MFVLPSGTKCILLFSNRKNFALSFSITVCSWFKNLVRQVSPKSYFENTKFYNLVWKLMFENLFWKYYFDCFYTSCTLFPHLHFHQKLGLPLTFFHNLTMTVLQKQIIEKQIVWILDEFEDLNKSNLKIVI